MNFPCAWRTVTGLMMVVLLLDVKLALAQTDGQNTPIEVLCLTERPAIVQGESTDLRAWAVSSDGKPSPQPIQFEWQVTVGVVQDAGAEVQWDLSGIRIEPGDFHKKVTATVTVPATNMGNATCSVDVFIGKREISPRIVGGSSDTRGGLRSARSYLLPNEEEESGYGLYSYLLFPVPPRTEEERSRYLNTLESCLLVMQAVEEHIKRHRRPSQLNATHIPVTEVPNHSQESAEWAANALTVYDYTTAQKLLDKLDKTYQRGPYLISVLKKPLSVRTMPVQEHLLQDFTGKVPELASRVVDLFTYRAAQQRKWSEETFLSFRLNLRNLIAVAGKVTPKVASALITLVQLNQAK